MNPKELAKLAKACRAAGIKSYKSGDVEFTLTDDAPQKKSKIQTAKVHHEQGDIEAQDTWEALSDEQKLFYSVNPGELEAPSESN